MDNIQIPPATPDWTQRVVLDDQPYYLTFTLNERTNRWHLSLADSNNLWILQGRKVLTGVDLLRGIGNPNHPPGMLMVVDYSGKNRQPTYENLGPELELVYLSFDDVQALGVA